MGILFLCAFICGDSKPERAERTPSPTATPLPLPNDEAFCKITVYTFSFTPLIYRYVLCIIHIL